MGDLIKSKYFKILIGILIIYKLGDVLYGVTFGRYLDVKKRDELHNQFMSKVKSKHSQIDSISYDLTRGLNIKIKPNITLNKKAFKSSIKELACSFLKSPDISYKALNVFVVYASDVRYPVDDKLIGSWLFFSNKCT